MDEEEEYLVEGEVSELVFVEELRDLEFLDIIEEGSVELVLVERSVESEEELELGSSSSSSES